jgi:hypothetical protein
MKTLKTTLCAVPLTFFLASCPGEAEEAAPDTPTGTEASDVDTEEIDAAADEAANKIDETNADEELENLETEIDGDGE